MAEGLKINLGTLEDVSKSCKEDGQISDLVGYSQDKINKIQHKVLLMRGKTHREFHELLNDLEDEIRGLKNNIVDVSEDIDKYINKMTDATPIDADNDIFVSSSFDNIKTKSTNLEEDFQSYKNGLTNASITEERPRISFGDLTDDEKDSHEKKVDVYDVYTDLLSTLNDSFVCETYMDEVKDQTKNILGFYDQDYDMSDHLKDLGVDGIKVAGGFLVGVISSTAAGTLGLPAGATAAVAIGIESKISYKYTFITTFTKDYISGDSLEESLKDAHKKGNSSQLSTIITAGIANQFEIGGLKNKNLEAEFKNISSKYDFNSSLKQAPKGEEIGIDRELVFNNLGKELNFENLVKTSITTPVGNEISDGIYQANLSDILTDYPDEDLPEIEITYNSLTGEVIKIESI